jgi:hypothetical protein
LDRFELIILSSPESVAAQNRRLLLLRPRRRDENEDRQVDYILRIFKAYEMVTTNMIVRACGKRQVSLTSRDGTFDLVVHEGKIPIAPDCQEIWERLSDRESGRTAEESEMGTVEPRILPS